jgi:molecular chaperone HscA
MLQESFGSADEDMRARALREQQVEAQRLLEATVAALAADGDLLSVDERNAIERLVADTAAHLQGSDIAAIRAATEALVAGTDDFAARRMDRSIRGALAGRAIEELAK